jgi:hypothetical protein
MGFKRHGIETRFEAGNDLFVVAYKFFVYTPHGLTLPFAKRKMGLVPVGIELVAPDALAPDAARANWPVGWYCYSDKASALASADTYRRNTGAEVEVREVLLRSLEVAGYEEGLPVVTGLRMTVGATV